MVQTHDYDKAVAIAFARPYSRHTTPGELVGSLALWPRSVATPHAPRLSRKACEGARSPAPAASDGRSVGGPNGAGEELPWSCASRIHDRRWGGSRQNAQRRLRIAMRWGLTLWLFRRCVPTCRIAAIPVVSLRVCNLGGTRRPCAIASAHDGQRGCMPSSWRNAPNVFERARLSTRRHRRSSGSPRRSPLGEGLQGARRGGRRNGVFSIDALARFAVASSLQPNVVRSWRLCKRLQGSSFGGLAARCVAPGLGWRLEWVTRPQLARSVSRWGQSQAVCWWERESCGRCFAPPLLPFAQLGRRSPTTSRPS